MRKAHALGIDECIELNRDLKLLLVDLKFNSDSIYHPTVKKIVRSHHKYYHALRHPRMAWPHSQHLLSGCLRKRPVGAQGLVELRLIRTHPLSVSPTVRARFSSMANSAYETFVPTDFVRKGVFTEHRRRWLAM